MQTTMTRLGKKSTYRPETPANSEARRLSMRAAQLKQEARKLELLAKRVIERASRVIERYSDLENGSQDAS